MDENSIQQNSKLEQLENLKKEQAEAEKNYNRRMQIGALDHDSASIQQLAQTIVDRKLKIENLKAQVNQGKKEDIEYEKNSDSNADKKNNNEQQAMAVYTGKNPFLRWLQKIIDNIDQRIKKSVEKARRNPMDWYKEKFEQEMVDLRDKQYTEYEAMANMNAPESQPEEKSSHKLFTEEISANGDYHTYKLNAKATDSDKTKSIEEQIEPSSTQISER